MDESKREVVEGENRLLEPFELGGVRLRNRVVFPAMLTNFATEEGFATQRNVAFYRARARGGTGLIILEATAVSPEGISTRNMLALYRDDYVPNLSELVAAVKSTGAALFIQLTHAGRETSSELIGTVPVGASPLPGRTSQDVPQELDEKGVERIISDFVAAARRAGQAGFDGVEFCAGRNDLIQQFLSSASNRRSDAFGGELWGRSRLLRDIVTRTREELGPDYPLIVRLSCLSEADGGLSMSELKELARALEGIGVFALEIGQTVEFPQSVTRLVGPDGRITRPSPPRDIKSVVGIPVIDEGNVRDLDEAADILRNGHADLVAVGRPLVTDPDLVVKAGTASGEPRPCIYNNVCRGSEPVPVMRCPVNPMVGREQIYENLPQVSSQRKVVFLGAGLVGMQAACLAAEVGFHVTLHEESGFLGGLLALRARIPVQSDNYRIVDYLSKELVRRRVRLKLHSAPTSERLLAESPDAVFVTRRGGLLKPEVTGLDNVGAVDPAQVLAGEVRVGQKVCVIGGGLLAAEIAYFLALRKKTVTLLDLPHLCHGYDSKLQKRSLAAFGQMEGHVVDRIRHIEINSYGEVIVLADGRTHKIMAETIVLAGGYETADDKYNALADGLGRFYAIGDAYESVVLTDLVYQGAQAVIDLAADCA